MIPTNTTLGLTGGQTLLSGLAADPTAYQGLSRLARSGDSEAALDAAARAFESLLIGQMLKQMRSAALSDGLFDSAYTQLYQDLYDQQIAALISQGDGLGIRKALLRQLAPRNKEAKPGGREASALVVPERIPWLKSLGMRVPAQQPPAPDTSVPGTFQTALSQATDTGAMEPATGSGDLGGRWPPRNAEEFVAYLKPYAQQAATVLGMDTSVLLAQSALETGWGRSIPRRADGRSSFNLFGIKADRSWQGDSVTVGTLEYRDGVARREQARFRAYDNPAESFIDYVAFLKCNPRYREALQSDTAESFIRGLQRAGYATDPRYADKVLSLRNRVLAIGAAGDSPNEGTSNQAGQARTGAGGAGSLQPSGQSPQVSALQADDSTKG
ncbi:flagellar assembly peptidoglycan hydrolase FlgJ [Caldichromatium japonicum]|uniref:Peptidoglycan hydrolase FlgJ n=1 Tax=Caldichromatium japonicum TaxID=2699430 RepID=A0A6G7VDC6_9GAMM|nr:flagellar assembly peptidoglycan hydrolase FlgJ [Caldichromatium japonicum]QIK37974.1 flagellar assembly peptidoglycan hydrolase FlgJ [Caldichromatium japonicum]